MTAGGGGIERRIRGVKKIVIVFAGMIITFGCGVKNAGESSDFDLNQQESTQIDETNFIRSPGIPEESKSVVSHENIMGDPLILETLSEEDKELFLTGAWQLYFPMPDSNWGHEFKVGHEYSYWDFSREALEERYWYTDGEWRIEKDEIQVKIVSYRISDRDAKEDVLGFRFPPDAKFITVPVNGDTWYSIGTIKSVRIGIVQNGLEYPPRITLRPLRFDRVLDKEVHYYRDRP